MIPVPCDTIARFAHLLDDSDVPEAFRCFRLDNGKILASDKRFMAIEPISPFEGVYHIVADEAMIETCRKEAQFGGIITFTPVPAIGYTTAVTNMGAKLSQNLGWFGDAGDFDLWYERVVAPSLDALVEPVGPLAMVVDEMVRLARTSPSGQVIFESALDPERRSAVVRDVTTGDWCGFFMPRIKGLGAHVPAAVPGWLRRPV